MANRSPWREGYSYDHSKQLRLEACFFSERLETYGWFMVDQRLDNAKKRTGFYVTSDDFRPIGMKSCLRRGHVLKAFVHTFGAPPDLLMFDEA